MWRPSEALAAVMAGERPGYVERFLSAVGKAAHEHGMIRPGDEVLVGLSGGKDSLALLLALERRRRLVRGGYGLRAVRVEWEAWPLGDEAARDLGAYADYLGVPYEVVKGPAPESIRERGLSCYLCSRERRRALLGQAERLGSGVLALGHHLDDFAETALMNLCKHGRLEPMRPAAVFFDAYRLVRPLCRVRESSIRTLAERLSLPVVGNPCPLGTDNARARYKSALAELAKIDTLVRENLVRAAAKPGSEAESWTSIT